MKSTIRLSCTHTSNICLECSGGRRCKEDGKWREERQRREKGGGGAHKGGKDQWKENEWEGKLRESRVMGTETITPEMIV